MNKETATFLGDIYNKTISKLTGKQAEVRLSIKRNIKPYTVEIDGVPISAPIVYSLREDYDLAFVRRRS